MFRFSLNTHPTGIVDLEIRFDIGTGEKIDKRSYFEKIDADKYLYSCKKSYILILYEKYVNHARILQEVGKDRAFYNTDLRNASLDRCIRAMKWFPDQSLVDICRFILKLQHDIGNILPSQSNNSYESSKNRMWDIIVFARSEAQLTNVTSLKKTENA